MTIRLYFRKCDNCKGGMSRGYIMHEGEYYFCNDDCISNYWSNKKVFTTLEDWNNNGSGLTWQEFNLSWDDLEDDSYAYEWQLDICSYTEWADGCDEDSVYDSKGREYILKDVKNNKKYLIVNGEVDSLH